MFRTVLIAALLAAVPLSASAKVLFRADYETGDISQWERTQIVSADRAQVVDDPVAEGKKALKVTVKKGDDPISSSGNRNELVKMTLEPEGSERWYRWHTMWAEDYPSEDTWQLFVQWHHRGNSGSPPVLFEVRGENIRMRSDGNYLWTTPLVRGKWHEFIFHVKWSPDSKKGFVELWFDGEHVLPKTNVATQFSGQLNYLKLGLYRNDTISKTGVVFHDGFVMGETLEDVKPEVVEPPAPPVEPTDPTPTDPAPTDPGPTDPTPTDPEQPEQPQPTDPTDPTEPTDPVGPMPTLPFPDDTGEVVEPGTDPVDTPDVIEGEQEANVGCSAASGAPAIPFALALLALARRRRK